MQSINPKQRKQELKKSPEHQPATAAHLSKEALSKYPGLEELTSKEAETITQSLRLFSQLTYELFTQQQSSQAL